MLTDSQTTETFCPGCGTVLSAGQNFCPKCGRQLLRSEVANGAGDQPTTEMRSDTAAGVPRQPHPRPGFAAAPPPPAMGGWPPAAPPLQMTGGWPTVAPLPPAGDSSGITMSVLAVVIVLALLGIAAAVILVVASNDSNSTPQLVTAPTTVTVPSSG
jgi:predicted RNA-binding Zn-ribbon protein involved in translation (DUF1610 family)